MPKIYILKARIESLSPLFIGDDDGEILLDHDDGKAYLPATSIAGSFRAYLCSINEDCKKLFGSDCDENKTNKNDESKIFIKDAFSDVDHIDLRTRVSIDDELGSGKDKSKIDEEYLSSGLNFELLFEIKIDDGDDDLKKMLYKCFKALNEGLIRFGSNKSNGLGVFKVNRIEEKLFNLSDRSDFIEYLKYDYENMIDVTKKVLEMDVNYKYTVFTIKGRFTTPLLIGAHKTFDINDADKKSVKTESGYIVPGSSFKGILRSRIEKIANYFDGLSDIEKIFGDTEDSSDKHSLSRVFVNESLIDDSEYKNNVFYNRIKIDRFTGGVRNTALMNDEPIKGNIEFKVIYRKSDDDLEIDNFVIGILLLALRDMGTENLSLGGGNSLGRGRFKADSMEIKDDGKIIFVDFEKKHISDQETINKYIGNVKLHKEGVGKDE